MKQLLLTLVLLLSVNIFAQQKYLTKTGTITFEASVPAFEEVKGTNKNTTAIINTNNGEFAALVLVKGFRFKNALMEEHFNENYAESDDFPKATFKGQFENLNLDALNTSKVKIQYNGSLTFHGKTKELKNEKLSISKSSNGEIHLTGILKVNVDDFNIEIPKIVSNKLSREVNVYVDFLLQKK